MVAWGLNIRELHLVIVGGKGRGRQRRKASADILVFIAEEFVRMKAPAVTILLSFGSW